MIFRNKLILALAIILILVHEVQYVLFDIEATNVILIGTLLSCILWYSIAEKMEPLSKASLSNYVFLIFLFESFEENLEYNT